MKKLIILIFVFFGINAFAQEGKSELDKAFPGGTAIFRVAISNNLEYPRVARANGTVGTSIFTFGINCESKLPYDFRFETVMDDGVEEAIIEAVQETKGSWLMCSSNESERIRIKISFTINNEGPVARDALVVINARGPGIEPVDDTTLINRAMKASEKNKNQKAAKYIQQLIARYPDNPQYRKMLEDLKPN